MKKKDMALIPIIIMLCLFAGCSGDKKDDASELALIKTTKPPAIELKSRPDHESIAYQVRKDLKKIDQIYDTAVIEGEKQVIVAYKVKHLHRFQMKKIEKDITKLLEKNYPEDEFIVSSDYKIFLEAIRLKEKLDHENLSNKEAEKRFKKIIKLKKEMT